MERTAHLAEDTRSLANAVHLYASLSPESVNTAREKFFLLVAYRSECVVKVYDLPQGYVTQ